jgi:hypothetical protein
MRNSRAGIGPRYPRAAGARQVRRRIASDPERRRRAADRLGASGPTHEEASVQDESERHEGSFAEGEETRPRDEHEGSFAEGEETLPRDRHHGSFAEGEETLPHDEHEGSFAEGEEEIDHDD